MKRGRESEFDEFDEFFYLTTVTFSRFRNFKFFGRDCDFTKICRGVQPFEDLADKIRLSFSTSIEANSVHCEDSEDEEAHAAASVWNAVNPLASLAKSFAPRCSRARPRTTSHSLAALCRHVSDRIVIRVLRIESIPDGSFNTRDRITDVLVVGVSSTLSLSSFFFWILNFFKEKLEISPAEVQTVFVVTKNHPRKTEKKIVFSRTICWKWTASI